MANLFKGRKFYKMSWDPTQIITDGLTYDAIKALGTSAAISLVGAWLGRHFKKLESIKDIIYFFAACTVALFLVLILITPKTQGPQLAGGIQQVISGPMPATNDRDTVSVVSMSILNSGNAQSVAKNWSIYIKMDDQIYTGSFISPPPKDFTFSSNNTPPGTPIGITYHGSDDLLEKASASPIQAGGMSTGVLFVLFKEVKASAVKSGAEFFVSYEDAQSHKYTASAKVTARPESIISIPGVHADLVCPAPPNFSPKPPTTAPGQGISSPPDPAFPFGRTN